MARTFRTPTTTPTFPRLVSVADIGGARFTSPSGTWYAAADDGEAERFWHRLAPIHTRAIVTRDELAGLPVLLTGLDATTRTAVLADLNVVKAAFGPGARLQSVRPANARAPQTAERRPVDTTAAPEGCDARSKPLPAWMVANLNARMKGRR